MTVVAGSLPLVARGAGALAEAHAQSVGGTRAYVTNTADGTVSVVDVSSATPTVEATVEVGDAPTGVVASPDGAQVFVMNTGAQLSDHSGTGVADVVNSVSTSISVIDTATHEVVATWLAQAGNVFTGAAVSPDASRLYAVATSTPPGLPPSGNAPGRLFRIDTSTGAISTGQAVLVGRGPTGVAVSPDGTRAYVTNTADGTVSVVDVSSATPTVEATVEVGDAPTGVAINDLGTDDGGPTTTTTEPSTTTTTTPPTTTTTGATTTTTIVPKRGPDSTQLGRVAVMPSGTIAARNSTASWTNDRSPSPLVVDPENGVGLALSWGSAGSAVDPSVPWGQHPELAPTGCAAELILHLYDLSSATPTGHLCLLGGAVRWAGGGARRLLRGFAERIAVDGVADVGGRVIFDDGRASMLSPNVADPGDACLGGHSESQGRRYRPAAGSWESPDGEPSTPVLVRRPCGMLAGHPTGATHMRASVFAPAGGGVRELVTLESTRLETRVRGEGGAFPVLADRLHDMRGRAGDGFLVRDFRVPALTHETLLAPADAQLQWEVDLRDVCPSWLNHWVARTDDAVLTYCYEQRMPGRFGFVPGRGAQGYLVRIPLDADGMPVPRRGTGDSVEFVPGSRRVLNATIRRIPTFTGEVVPVADPETGRVLLITNDSVNGAAVWVLDPREERFMGAASRGLPPDAVSGRSAVGFNVVSGRAYVLAGDEVLVVDGRRDPPFVGIRAKVPWEQGERITPGVSHLSAVTVGGRELLIAPVVGKGYVVFEDLIPFSGRDETSDLDSRTTQVEEHAGRTIADFSGGARGVGAHVIGAGGAARTAQAQAPTCNWPFRLSEKDRDEGDDEAGSQTGQRQLDVAGNLVEVERRMFDGDCLAGLWVSEGHREAYLGSSHGGSGTAEGAFAGAQSVEVPESDSATSSDLRALGRCRQAAARSTAEGGFDYLAHAPQGLVEAIVRVLTAEGSKQDALDRESFEWVPVDPDDRYSHQLAPALDPSFGGYDAACAALWEQVGAHADAAPGVDEVDPSSGTAGVGGAGFPARSVECTGGRSGTTWQAPADAMTGRFPSSVRCRDQVPAATAASSVATLVIPSADEPLVVVDSSSSAVDSARRVVDGKAYQVTQSWARAEGIQIGPVSIGEVRATAVAVAGGLKGKASASLVREWCDVAIAGEPVKAGCSVVIGPEDPLVATVADELRQAVPNVRLSVPEAERTAESNGYQAVVTKDEGLRAADSTVNADNSITVPALQVTVVSDGGEGRNRWIVQLAGVHAEATYGISLLPHFDVIHHDPRNPQPGSVTRPAPGSTRFIPGTPGRRASYDFGRTAYVIEDAVLARSRDRDPISSLFGWIPEALKDLWRLIVQHPVEFFLLFGVFSMLASPVYLAHRRRRCWWLVGA
jgi:YVTN family beta-propeller protein